MKFNCLFCKAAVIVCILTLLPCAAYAQKTIQETDNNAEKIQRELLRRRKAREWYRKSKPRPTQRQYMLELYKPVIVGNRKDYERNQRFAARYNELAAQATKDETIEKYEKIAQLFQLYARQNEAVVKAINDGNAAELEKAFERIKKIEGVVHKQTGKHYKRDWLMPDELSNRTI